MRRTLAVISTIPKKFGKLNDNVRMPANEKSIIINLNLLYGKHNDRRFK